MKHTVWLVLLLAFGSTLAPSTWAGHKETEAQRRFISDYAKALERTGWRVTWVGVRGKQGEILAVDLPGATVEALYRFKKQCVDAGDTKDRMKQAGFHSVRIYSGVQSMNFPKGEFLIPLD